MPASTSSRDARSRRVRPLAGLWILALASNVLGASGCGALYCGFWTSDHRDEAAIIDEGLRRWGAIRLFEKEARVRETLIERHFSPEGVLLYQVPAEQSADRPWYSDFADQAAWQGALCAALALRAEAEPSEEAETLLKRALEGLHLLCHAGGKAGQVSRNVVVFPPGEPPPWVGPDRYAVGSGEFEGFAWRRDPGKAQFAGLLYGAALAHAALAGEDPERRRLERDIAAIVTRLIDDGWAARDFDGSRCTYGDFTETMLGLGLGIHRLAQVGWTVLAAKVGGDQRLDREARALLDGDLGDLDDRLTFEALGMRNRNNDVLLCFVLGAFLASVEHEEARAQGLSALNSWFQGPVTRERNPFFTYLWARWTPAGACDATFRKRVLDDARLTLRLFPWDLRIFEHDHRARTDVPYAFFLNFNRGFAPQARDPFFVHEQARDSFCFKQDPYQLVTGRHGRGEWEVSGVDFLLAYWMGRRYGFLSSDE